LLIIAERINSTRKSIAEATEAKDAALIQEEAKAQAEAGADYVDVNAGTFIKEEADYLKWLIQVVQEVTDLPLHRQPGSEDHRGCASSGQPDPHGQLHHAGACPFGWNSPFGR